MLSTTPIIEAVAEMLAQHRLEKLVVDPVMVAKSGDPLLQPDARAALADRILPLALVVTPNLPEAEVLAGMPVAEPEDMEEAARRIHRWGRATCWSRAATSRATRPTCSGTGASSRASPRPGSTPRTPTAPAAPSRPPSRPGLARGQALGDAIRSAKAYVTRAIREGFKAGRGVGQLRHFIPDW